jgi:NitT/TauT family transport system ATP-binding protein
MEATAQTVSPAEAGGRTGSAITVEHVAKWFPTADGQALHALQDIDLAVAEGSILAILGASGCGKSTLLNIISGILKPDGGRVCINGVPADAFDDWRSVSYMFQEDRLLPWRTARRNVEFALEAGSTPKPERRRRAEEALELVGLSGFVDAFPYQLSGGMRSRVALARSLVLEPCILLMDEPFSRLDAQTRSLMHAELLRIHQLKNVTIVFVTHDVEESVVLADRVVVMAPRPGRVREDVAIELARPRDPTTPQVTQYIQRLRALI